MRDSSKVVCRYFPEFKGDEVLLFVGDQQELKWMTGLFESVTQGVLNSYTALELLPMFDVNCSVSIVLVECDSRCGIKNLSQKALTPRFEWYITRALAMHFIELIIEVISSDGPSHQYLDSGLSDDVTVIVSKGEYDNSLLREH